MHSIEERIAIWKSHQALARKLANRFAGMYNRDQQELFEEARTSMSLELFTRWETFDLKKSSVTHWLYQCIYWSLLTYCTRAQEKAIPFSALDNEEQLYQPAAKPSRTETILQELSEEGQFLVRTIINAPDEIIDDLRPQTKARGRRAVRNWLLSHGWDRTKLDRAWQEVQECLQ